MEVMCAKWRPPTGGNNLPVCSVTLCVALITERTLMCALCKLIITFPFDLLIIQIPRASGVTACAWFLS